MRVTRTSLLLALLFVIGLPLDAAALVMCARVKQSTGEIRNGTPIRLRAECKTKEVQVDPAALGLQGPPGVQGPHGDPGTDGADGSDGVACWDTDVDLTCDAEEDVAEPPGCGVEDCLGVAKAPTFINHSGENLGPVAARLRDVTRPYLVYVAESSVLVLDSEFDPAQPEGLGTQFFETPDCSDAPLMTWSPAVPQAVLTSPLQAALTTDRTHILVPTSDEKPPSRTVQSYVFEGTDFCVEQRRTGFYVPFKTIDLPDGFRLGKLVLR